MERLTNQKRIILEYLRSVKTHPTAEKVYLEVKKKLPQISLGTVYRILNNLSEKKSITRIAAEASRFDGDTFSHAHYICRKCGVIFDIYKKYDVLKDKKIKVGKVENYQVYFYGICKKCSKKTVS